MTTTVKPKTKRNATRPNKRKGGFTIVELLVSAVIMTIAVVAIVAVVRKSTEMQITDYHRRQARAVAMSEFETTFGFNKFATGGYSSNAYEYNVNLADADVDERVEVSDIEIVKNIGDNTFNGNMTVGVTLVNRNVGLGAGNDILAHVIDITVSWVEPTGHTESITLTKELTSIDL